VTWEIKEDNDLSKYSVDLERDYGGCDNMECIQELLVSNVCRMACLGIECKPSLERGLMYCSIERVLLESAQLWGITAQ
jgi:hypothetical protein